MTPTTTVRMLDMAISILKRVSVSRPITVPPAGPEAFMMGSKKRTKKKVVPTQKMLKRMWIVRRMII